MSCSVVASIGYSLVSLFSLSMRWPYQKVPEVRRGAIRRVLVVAKQLLACINDVLMVAENVCQMGEVRMVGDH